MVNPSKSYIIDMGLADAFLMVKESNIGRHLLCFTFLNAKCLILILDNV